MRIEDPVVNFVTSVSLLVLLTLILFLVHHPLEDRLKRDTVIIVGE